jgi:hypothetical protein
MRPASGWFTPSMIARVEGQGLRLALGVIAPRDLRLRDTARALRFVARRLQPGAIVVLHEHHPPPERLAALTEGVIEKSRALDLRPVTLSELVP